MDEDDLVITWLPLIRLSRSAVNPIDIGVIGINRIRRAKRFPKVQ